ncbi:MAG: hypothetical protein ACK4IT_02990 [Thioalkalivibrionaceae bacterium]
MIRVTAIEGRWIAIGRAEAFRASATLARQELSMLDQLNTGAKLVSHHTDFDPTVRTIAPGPVFLTDEEPTSGTANNPNDRAIRDLRCLNPV